MVVRGRNFIFKIAGEVIACARNVSYTSSTSMIETTTVGDGKDATFLPQKNVHSGTAEGVTFLNEAGKIALPKIRKHQLDHDLLSGTFERTDEAGNEYNETFNFYITETSDNGTAGDVANFNFNFQITGRPVVELVCFGLVTPEDVVITNEGGSPVTYEATWDFGGDTYTIGTFSFYFSIDDGETWELVAGGTFTSPDTLAYTLEEALHVPHKLKVKITCPNWAEVYEEAIGTIA